VFSDVMVTVLCMVMNIFCGSEFRVGCLSNRYVVPV
jgi:hypothetical protein